MVGVVQLVERQIVILFVVGSSPIVHPIYTLRRTDDKVDHKAQIVDPELV